MKAKTTHPGQGELFPTTDAKASAATEPDEIRELRERLRQPLLKSGVSRTAEPASKLSAMVRGEVFKF